MNIQTLEAKNPRGLSTDELYTLLDSYGVKPMITEDDMMHGMPWQGEDLTGWVATEKLDGVRAYWDGQTLWTRSGKPIRVPDHWALPAGVHLDGELFAGYGKRQECVNAARYGKFTKYVRFVAFDAPRMNAGYLDRLRFANGIWNDRFNNRHLWSDDLSHNTHMRAHLKCIQEKGGEGLMVRHPDLAYHAGRTHLMLKVK